MAPDGENFRGVNATRLLSKVDSINLDELIKLGYDNFLPAFEVLIPGFVEKTKDKVDLEIMPIRDMFKDWDYRGWRKLHRGTIGYRMGTKIKPQYP